MKLKAWFSVIFTVIFALAGVLAAALGIWGAFRGLNSQPVMVKTPESARQQVQTLMEAVARGDYHAAGELLQGKPSLGADRQAQEEAGRLLWDAFLGSFRYELVGELYATEDGIRQDVAITGLKLSSVTGSLSQRTRELLQQQLEQAEDVSQIYDESNNFREDVVMATFLQAMEQAIAQDGITDTVTVTVRLVYEDGQWRIVPDGALLSAISGGILG